MSRSWWELKIFFIALPLLCAARTLERVGLLIAEPVYGQHLIFGHVVAYPWALRRAAPRPDWFWFGAAIVQIYISRPRTSAVGAGAG